MENAGARSGRASSRASKIVALGALLSAGCVGQSGKNERAGMVAPGVDSAISQVVIAWAQGPYPIEGSGIPEPLEIWGTTPITDGSFDLDDLVAPPESEAPDPPTLTCMPEGAAGLSVGLLLGMGSDVGDGDHIGLADFTDSTAAYSDDVLAVYSNGDVLPGTAEWYMFETVIPEGISLQRHVPCTMARMVWCRPFYQLRINCFEPLPQDAVVILSPLPTVSE